MMSHAIASAYQNLGPLHFQMAVMTLAYTSVTILFTMNDCLIVFELPANRGPFFRPALLSKKSPP